MEVQSSRESIRVVGLLTAGTCVAIFSFFLQFIVGAFVREPWPANLRSACLIAWPILGFVSMWLCSKAAMSVRRKGIVAIYLVALAPFAFGYPGWMLLLLASCVFRGCTGPMP